MWNFNFWLLLSSVIILHREKHSYRIFVQLNRLIFWDLYRSFWLFNRLIYGFFNWLLNGFFHRFLYGFLYWLFYWLLYWFLDRLFNYLLYWFLYWLFNRLFNRLLNRFYINLILLDNRFLLNLLDLRYFLLFDLLFDNSCLFLNFCLFNWLLFYFLFLDFRQHCRSWLQHCITICGGTWWL